jgi:hypothetical protein
MARLKDETNHTPDAEIAFELEHDTRGLDYVDQVLRNAPGAGRLQLGGDDEERPQTGGDSNL